MTIPRRMTLVFLCLPMFLVLLDVLAMNTALPTIGTRFAIGVEQWPRLIDAYTVPLALGLLPAGWVVDRWTPRAALLAGVALFGVASGLGAVASAWSVVLLARVVQGAAAAVMLPAGLAAVAVIWHEPGPRARALGAWSGISAIATALGPAVGGLLVAALDWRAVFWVNVPVAVVAWVGTWRTVPPGEAVRPGASAPRATARVVASVVVAAMMTSGANGTLQVLGGAAMVTLGHAPGALRVGPALLGIGLGLGLMTSAIVGESMAAWPARPGLVGGLNNAMRQLGTSVGVAVGGWASGAWGGTLLTRWGALAGSWWLLGAGVVLALFGRRR